MRRSQVISDYRVPKDTSKPGGESMSISTAVQ
jgi:hypothetical protein